MWLHTRGTVHPCNETLWVFAEAASLHSCFSGQCNFFPSGGQMLVCTVLCFQVCSGVWRFVQRSVELVEHMQNSEKMSCKTRAENFHQTVNVWSQFSIKWVYYEQRVGIVFAHISLLLKTVFMFNRLAFCLCRSEMYSVSEDPTTHLFFCQTCHQHNVNEKPLFTEEDSPLELHLRFHAGEARSVQQTPEMLHSKLPVKQHNESYVTPRNYATRLCRPVCR